ncbi:hypothetical protein C7H19_20590 [Aphanothece hegewaldii CCALA 016]|uniref:Uncharacterized protein n=1 Tax=Aphanothece hegewaldii CCALA 016 TaxID=2107694 RepID=A0A2T1LT03_9CHRO|nr:hypothetical protein [Aphanothece hegewaldii]PSF33094.1 hypothetical protein C7H19_20590 [Aphanothece hegewaldii CCALA 016]
MAKLPDEATEQIWHLKKQLLDIIDQAKVTEFVLFERFGETERTLTYLDDLQNIAEQATERFSQFSRIQIQIAAAQPDVFPDILELVTQAISNTQARIPALQRSIQEIKIEWQIP